MNDELNVKLTDENVNQLSMMINKDLCDEIDKKEKIIHDIKFYIEQNDIKNMLWGKEILKIIERD